MNKYILYVIFAVSFCASVPSLAQKSAKEYLKEGNAYYEVGKYDKALENYFQVQRVQPLNNEIQTRMALCYFQNGNIAEAVRYLTYVSTQQEKIDPVVALCMAECMHQTLDFKEAIRWYKKYLAVADKSDQRREGAKDDVKRCAIGLRIKDLSTEHLVQNLGENINSAGDEFGAILSPRSEGKIYFSSAREISLGGLRDENGLRDDKKGNYCSDIFSSELDNGEWGTPKPLSYLLNSARHDVALDFNSDGQVMYLYRGLNLFSGDILVDTFKTFEDRNIEIQPFVSPLQGIDGDGAPFFVNDTMMLFSSRRAGGYGGADLYYTVQHKGQWLTPKNLGADINTSYDETTPFLTTDGRTLFFSSNNCKSIGGFDIFKSSFVDDSLRWSIPENLAIPINSAGDDTHFRLTANGENAYFTSQRHEGFGRRDIYSVFFKRSFEAQEAYSKPDFFYKVKAYRDSLQATMPEVVATTKTPTIVNYTVQSLTYDKDVDLLSAKNQKSLNALLAILKKNNDTKVRFTIHTDDNASTGLDAFMGIKRGEKLAEYFIKEGVASNKIQIVSCGSNYPIALNIFEGEPSAAGQRFNRRIESVIINTDKSLKVDFETPQVPDYLQSGEYFRFQNLQKTLSYRLRIAAIKTMYNGDLITRYPDLIIEKAADEANYNYSIGLFGNYAQAERLKKELESQGVSSVMIIPYVQGWQILNDDEAKRMSTQYPDLQEFVKRKK